jgi:hypothetical protein
MTTRATLLSARNLTVLDPFMTCVRESQVCS